MMMTVVNSDRLRRPLRKHKIMCWLTYLLIHDSGNDCIVMAAVEVGVYRWLDCVLASNNQQRRHHTQSEPHMEHYVYESTRFIAALIHAQESRDHPARINDVWIDGVELQ